MSKRAAKPTALSPQQHQLLREKLTTITRSIQAGQLKQASAALQPMLRKHPNVHEVCHVVSGLSAAQHEHDRAMYYAQRAAELAPHIAEYHAALGTLLIQQDQNQQAIEPLQRALELSPNLPRALVPLGTARMQLGDIDDSSGDD